MTSQVSGGGTQLSEEGLDQMRGVHQRHLDNLGGAVSLAGEMAQGLQAGNPFGLGEDGSASYQSATALTDALRTAVQDERDNLEKLWAHFRTWGELVVNADLGAAQGIASAAPHEER